MIGNKFKLSVQLAIYFSYWTCPIAVFHANISLALFSPHHNSQYLFRNGMLIHEAKYANVKYFASSELQFMVPILQILLLIQLEGWNNLADFKPETVWVGKIGFFFYQNMGLFAVT